MNAADIQAAIRQLPLTVDNLLILLTATDCFAAAIAAHPRANEAAYEASELITEAFMAAEKIYLAEPSDDEYQNTRILMDKEARYGL